MKYGITILSLKQNTDHIVNLLQLRKAMDIAVQEESSNIDIITCKTYPDGTGETAMINTVLWDLAESGLCLKVSNDIGDGDILRFSDKLYIDGISFGFIPGKCDIIDSVSASVPGSPWCSYTYLILKNMSKYISSGTNVIDIGCGRGNVCFLASKLGANTTGIDQSIDAIELCKKYASINSVECRFIADDMMNYVSYCNKTYDLAVCNLYIEEHELLIPTLGKILDKGSIVMTGGLDKNINVDKATNLLRNNGFNIVETLYWNDAGLIISRRL